MKTTHQASRINALPRSICNRLLSYFPTALVLIATFALVQLAGATSYTWNVASGNWSDLNSWSPNTGVGGPLAADSVIFGNTGAGSVSNVVNNTVDVNMTVANLTNNSVNSVQSNYIYQVTQIPSGVTLTVTNRLLVGGLNQSGSSTAFQTYAIMTGGGTLKITGTNLAVENYGTVAGANDYANLDLSGLSNFVFNNTNGIVSIADTTLPQTSGTLNVRAAGNLVLAGVSNSITATNINLGTCNAPQAGPTDTLTLGPGTNILNVGNFNIANNKNPANVVFAGPTGGLRIRGVIGTDTSRANVVIGNRSVGGGTGNTPGQMLLNGHQVDIMANTLVVGEVSVTAGPTTATQAGIGTLQFDTGTVDATSVVMAFNAAPNSTATALSRAASTLNVGAGATLQIGTGGLSLINQTASNVCSSLLIISNGTVVCNGNITAVTNVASGTGNAIETNTIQFISGGTLTLGSGAFAGTTTSPIGQFILDTNSTVKLVTPPNNNQPAIAVNSLVWPANDSALTFVVNNLPATATVGTTVPLIHFEAMSGGSFTAPLVTLPAGVTGTLSLSGNTVIVTITSTIYPSLTTISPSLTTLSTNKTLTTVASSTVSTITNVIVVATTNTLGGLTSTTITNSIGSPSLTVSGLGTGTASISYALNTNTFYSSVVVKVTDANGVSVSLPTGNFDTLVPALVIEASDFNYTNGLFLDTPANGGFALYTNTVGTEGIDEHKAVKAGTKSYYRTNDAVVVGNANPQFANPPASTEQKFVTALANGDTLNVEQCVSFNSVGDWLNYTRTFGPGGSAPTNTYNVWCYLAANGSGPQVQLSQVTSNPTLGGQTTNLLGFFGTSSFTDNSFNRYVYVPLVDEFGNRVAITAGSGQQTFKATILGNPNVGFYMLVPVAPVLTPVVLHAYPDGATPSQFTNQLGFTIGPANGAAVATSGIHLTLNGADVSSGLNFTSGGGGTWNVTYAIPSNEVFTATINVTNANGLSTSFSFSFDTFDPNNFQWEGVDYDFSTNNGTVWISGLFIDNPVPTGDTNAPYSLVSPVLATNSYNAFPTGLTPVSDPFGLGAIAIQGIDVGYTNVTGETFRYRSDFIAGVQTNQVGSEQATDYLRPKFLASQTNADLPVPFICQFDLGWFNRGYWVNYTRTYPAGNYKVWGRLAGGNGPFSGTTLSIVTNGVGTPNQLSQPLGTFSDPNAAGWQAWHWIPLLDTNGNKVVVSLGGPATLKLTSGNNLNVLFLMLAPAVAPGSFRISASLGGGQVNIAIPTQIGYNYTVWSASSLPAASWTQVAGPITGDGTVHVVAQPATGKSFYRVLAQ